MNAWELKETRLSRFRELLEMIEENKHKDQ